MKNTPSILISFQIDQKASKSGNFVYFDDFRVSWTRRLGINHVLKNIYLRVTEGMKY